MDDLLWQDAANLAAQIRSGDLSAETLMGATLARIAEVNPSINAIVNMADTDVIMAAARTADQTTAKGPLHGLPVAIKDLSNAAGFITSMGSPIFAQSVAAKDDVMVARMKAAGAIVIGKTNTPEFGLGSHSYNPVHGVTRNPYDLSKSAGGSSGGAAAALATGMLPIADGSDMMGSLRNPAAWCNVYGFRPTYGRVPSEPGGDMFMHQLSTSGPMGRSPQDVALLLDVQSGFDARDPHSFECRPVSGHLTGDVGGARIGWLGDWGGAYPMEPGIIALCEEALASFDDMGCCVETVSAPFPAKDIWTAWLTLRAWAVNARLGPLYDNPEMRAQLKPAAVWEIEKARSFSADDMQHASALRSAWFAKTQSLFDQYDALVLPTAQMWPFPADWEVPPTFMGAPMDTYHRWMEVVIPVSVLGLPCLNVPAGFSSSGLPMGLQIFGPRHSDADLLNIGHAWHEATDWAVRHPDPATLKT